MFSSAGASLRSAFLRGSGALPFPRPGANGTTSHTPRLCSAAAAGGAGALGLYLQQGARGSLMLGTGVVAAGAAVSNLVTSSGEQDQPRATSSVPWVQRLEASGEECLNPGAQLRKHAIAKYLVEDDHLFETMRDSAQIHEFRCFYEQADKRFHSVVQLGKDVCGFPKTVHGGLTAAIIDETFGGLGICMWKSGALGVRLPAYTARLEVDYKQKIPSGSLILCTTELEKVEGRKVYMRATVSDGKGQQYASARALFVAPRNPGETLVQTLAGWVTGGGRGGSSNNKQQRQ